MKTEDVFVQPFLDITIHAARAVQLMEWMKDERTRLFFLMLEKYCDKIPFIAMDSTRYSERDWSHEKGRRDMLLELLRFEGTLTACFSHAIPREEVSSSSCDLIK